MMEAKCNYKVLELSSGIEVVPYLLHNLGFHLFHPPSLCIMCPSNTTLCRTLEIIWCHTYTQEVYLQKPYLDFPIVCQVLLEVG